MLKLLSSSAASHVQPALVGAALRSVSLTRRIYLRSGLTRGMRFCAPQMSTESSSIGINKSISMMRTNIGFFGDMNAGKSTLMNSITQQSTSVVDSTPGTTTDTKISTMELHGLGPVKLFDTAGLNEEGLLGSKKHSKAIAILKEVDVAVAVVDALTKANWGGGEGGASASSTTPTISPKVLEREVMCLSEACRRGRHGMLAINIKAEDREGFERLYGLGSLEQFLKSEVSAAAHSMVTETLRGSVNQEKISELLLPPFFGDLSDGEGGGGMALGHHLVTHHHPEGGAEQAASLIPDQYTGYDRRVLLNVPMDSETPALRLLRPQAMVQERCLRQYSPTVCYRMDLVKGRNASLDKVEEEKRRFQGVIRDFLARGKEESLKGLVVTDSQAIDLVHPWTLDERGEPLVDITTFSVAMMNFQSMGKMGVFVDGLRALRKLREGDRVLVAEACNHLRIPDKCDDIGMVQIPRGLRNLLPEGQNLEIDHAFGREFSEVEDLAKYALVVHCGGCMIDRQKVRARIEDCQDAGVPLTNYGILFSYFHSQRALERVLRPWGLHLPEDGECLEQGNNKSSIDRELSPSKTFSSSFGEHAVREEGNCPPLTPSDHGAEIVEERSVRAARGVGRGQQSDKREREAERLGGSVGGVVGVPTRSRPSPPVRVPRRRDASTWFQRLKKLSVTNRCWQSGEYLSEV